MRSRIKSKNTRSLNEIYDQESKIHLQSIFCLFSQDRIYFEDEIKEGHWINAMNDEIESIERNDTSKLVALPNNNDCIGVKCVYKVKFKANGDVDKYKERLVAKLFSQEYGVAIMRHLHS